MFKFDEEKMIKIDENSLGAPLGELRARTEIHHKEYTYGEKQAVMGELYEVGYAIAERDRNRYGLEYVIAEIEFYKNDKHTKKGFIDGYEDFYLMLTAPEDWHVCD